MVAMGEEKAWTRFYSGVITVVVVMGVVIILREWLTMFVAWSYAIQNVTVEKVVMRAPFFEYGGLLFHFSALYD